MKTIYLVLLRNILIILFFAQLGYFLYRKFYVGVPTDWNSSSFITLVGGIGAMQLLLNKRTEKG